MVDINTTEELSKAYHLLLSDKLHIYTNCINT